MGDRPPSAAEPDPNPTTITGVTGPGGEPVLNHLVDQTNRGRLTEPKWLTKVLDTRVRFLKEVGDGGGQCTAVTNHVDDRSGEGVGYGESERSDQIVDKLVHGAIIHQ
jgi:hypothetical protein